MTSQLAYFPPPKNNANEGKGIFHLSKARRIFGEEGVGPEGCGCFKIDYHFMGRLSVAVICELYSNVVISPVWVLGVVRVATLCWGPF